MRETFSTLGDGRPIEGYEIIEKIAESAASVIYRGKIANVEDTVIIKSLKKAWPSPVDIARIKHENEIVKKLDVKGVVKSLGVVQNEEGIALIFEDSIYKFLVTDVPPDNLSSI